MPADRIKPTHKSIKEYYTPLAADQKTGPEYEVVLCAAFQELLTKLARQRGWTIVPERAVVREGYRVQLGGTLGKLEQ